MAGSMPVARAKAVCSLRETKSSPLGKIFVPQGQKPVSLPGVFFTNQAYGPVHAILWWEKDYKEPISLVTNVESTQDACNWYRKRFRIETFFSPVVNKIRQSSLGIFQTASQCHSILSGYTTIR
ncbi:MAG: hypothetical protein AB1611_10795 [bacterium]